MLRKWLLILGLSLCQYMCHVSGCWWSFITSSTLHYLGILMVFIFSLKRDLNYNCKYNSIFIILSKHLYAFNTILNRKVVICLWFIMYWIACTIKKRYVTQEMKKHFSRTISIKIYFYFLNHFMSLRAVTA